MRSIQSKSSLGIRPTVESIIQSGQITRQDHINLTSTLLSTAKMSDEDRIQINRIFDYIQSGRLKLVD